ncbi:MAG: four helix bundle protein [Bacteroidales bacterium]|nr:four helix bundle protein [Bacteroidales bacterium]
MKDSIVQNKSFAFAVQTIKICQYLTEIRHEYNLSKQLIRSSTSIGANIREARRAQSAADFVAKMSIALKEAEESRYWYELLEASENISPQQGEQMIEMCDEIVKMLSSIVKTMREKNS